MSLVLRYEYTNRSVLDGYLFEEILHYAHSCILRIISAFADLNVAKELIITEIQHYINASLKRLQKNKPAYRILHNFLSSPINDHTNHRLSVAFNCLVTRYMFSCNSKITQTDLHDNEFGEAFLTPSKRLFHRWYCALLRDEIFRQQLVAFRLARAKYFDHRFVNAIQNKNVQQIIILGAGFDTRGFRYEKLRAAYNNEKHNDLPLQMVSTRDVDPDTQTLIHSKQQSPTAVHLQLPKQMSEVSVSKSHINVIELETHEIQKRKVKAIVNHFSCSEAIKFGEGVLYVGCDFNDPLFILSALNGVHCDPSKNTLILAEDLISTLDVRVIDGMLKSLKQIWMSQRQTSHDVSPQDALSESDKETHPQGISNSCKSEWTFIFDYFTDIFVRGYSSVENRALLRRLKMVRTGFPQDDNQLKTLFSNTYGMKVEILLNEEQLVELAKINIKNWERCDHVHVLEAKFI